MEPVSAISLGVLIWDLFFKDKSGGPLSVPLTKEGYQPFSVQELQMFTSVEHSQPPGSIVPLRTRRFDRDLCPKLIGHLRARVARQLRPEQVHQAMSGVAVYQVLPWQPGLPCAAEVVEWAARHGHVVLGSLTLPLMQAAADVPYLLVVGPAGTERMAPDGVEVDPRTGQQRPAARFARLYAPGAEVVDAPAAQVVEAAAEPAADETAPTEPAPAPPAAEAEAASNVVPLSAPPPLANGVAAKAAMPAQEPPERPTTQE